MSQNPIHRALQNLLPTLNPLPQKLISATESLYSLSLQRTTLSSSEEPARPTLCAEIACRKLRVGLRLPNVKSGAGAPCGPSVYRRLLGLFGKTLEDVELLGSPRKNSPSSRSGVNTGSRSGNGSSLAKSTVKRRRDAVEREIEGTPSKKQKFTEPVAMAGSVTSRKGRPLKSFAGKQKVGVESEEAPSYVLPVVKTVCRVFRTPEPLLHVYTGTCVILRLAGLWPQPQSSNTAISTNSTTKTQRSKSQSRAIQPQSRSRSTPTKPSKSQKDEAEDTKSDIIALTISIYLLTLTRMQSTPMTTELFEAICLKTSHFFEIKSIRTQIESWIVRINTEGWTGVGTGLEWWESVPEDNIGAPDIPQILKSRATDAEAESESDAESADEEDDGTDPAENSNTRRSNHNQLRQGRDRDRDQVETEVEIQRRRLQARLKRQKTLRDQLSRLDEDTDDDVLLPGLGTMYTETEGDGDTEYEIWKKGMLEMIELIERVGGGRNGKNGEAEPALSVAVVEVQ